MKKMAKEEKKLIKQTNEDTNMVKKFLLILTGVIVIFLLLYFVTSKTLSDSSTKSAESTKQTITYDTINVGNIFNRPYDEYYVLAYYFDGEEAYDYTTAVTSYTAESTSIKLYSLDLTAKVNNSHVGDKSNKNATNASEVQFNGPTLIKIVNGKISRYYDNKEDILEALK